MYQESPKMSLFHKTQFLSMPVPEGLALPILDLSRNEKPDPVSDSLRIALGQAINKLGRYPVGLEDRVIDLIADTYQIPASHVMLVHGIDETLDSLLNDYRLKPVGC